MKRILSLILVLCMLLTSCVFFSACSKKGTSEKSLKKDTQEAIGNAIDKSLSAFFTDDAGIEDIIDGALNKGSLAISLESETLKTFSGLGLEKITETLYFNQKNKKMVSDTAVTIDGEKASVRIWADKSGIVLQSKDLFGNNNAFALKMDTFASKFADSDLVDLLDLYIDDNMQETMDLLTKSYKQAFEASEKDTAKNLNNLLATLEPVYDEAKMVDALEKEINCATVTYSFTNSTFKAFIQKAIEIADMKDTDMADMYDETVEYVTGNFTMNFTVTVGINKKNSQLVAIEIGGNMKSKTDTSYKLPVEGAIRFSDEKITVEGTAKMPEYDYEQGKVVDVAYTVSLDLTKESTKEEVIYKLSAKMKAAGVSTKFGDITYTYNKKSGDFTLKVKPGEALQGMLNSDNNITVKGNIQSDKKTATITIKSVAAGSVFELEGKLSLVFTKEAEMPAMPSDAKDIVTLKEEDLEQIMEDMEDAPFASLFDMFF